MSKPFSSLDHMGPEAIVEEEVRIHISPPSFVCSLDVLSGFLDTMESVLGDLQFSISVSQSRNKEGNYLEHRRVMSIAQRQSMFPVVPTTDITYEPTSG